MQSCEGKWAAISAIRSVPLGVIGPSHPGIRPEGVGGGKNSFIIRGDDHGVELMALLATLPNVLNERFPGDQFQRFAGETGGGPTGGNDGEASGH